MVDGDRVEEERLLFLLRYELTGNKTQVAPGTVKLADLLLGEPSGMIDGLDPELF